MQISGGVFCSLAKKTIAQTILITFGTFYRTSGQIMLPPHAAQANAHNCGINEKGPRLVQISAHANLARPSGFTQEHCFGLNSSL